MLSRVEYAAEIGCDKIVLKNIDGFEYDETEYYDENGENLHYNYEDDQNDLNIAIINLSHTYEIDVGMYYSEVDSNNLDYNADFILD